MTEAAARQSTGTLLVLLSACAYGTMAIFGKVAYRAGVNVRTLLALRYIIGAILLLAWLAAADLARSPRKPSGKDVLAGAQRWKVLGLGLIFAANSAAYFLALHRMPAATTSLVLYVYPAIVVALTIVVYRRVPPWREWAALVLALVGCAATLRVPLARGNVSGVLLALLTALIYAVFIIVGSTTLARVPPARASGLIVTELAMVFTATAALSGGLELRLTREAWLATAGLGVVSTGLAQLGFIAGLVRVGPSRAAILSMAEPLVTVLLAAWLLDERLARVQYLGGALILTAVLTLHLDRPPLAD